MNIYWQHAPKTHNWRLILEIYALNYYAINTLTGDILRFIAQNNKYPNE